MNCIKQGEALRRWKLLAKKRAELLRTLRAEKVDLEKRCRGQAELINEYTRKLLNR